MSKVIYIPHDLAGGVGSLIDSTTGAIITTYPLEPQASDWGVINTNQRFTLHKPFVPASPAEFPTLWEWDHVTTFTQVGTWDRKYEQTANLRPVGLNYWLVGTQNGGSLNTPGFHKHDQNGLWVLSKGPVPFIVNGVSPFCINETEALATYANGMFNGPIKTWNLTTNTAGADVLAAVGANTLVSELFAIAGSTDFVAILVFFDGATPTKYLMRRYTQTGTIVYEVVVETDTLISGDITTESGYDPDFSSIWIRWPGPPNFDSNLSSSFRQFRLSDGAALTARIDVPRVMGVPATTCPVIVQSFTPAPTPNPGSGIYKLVPNKRQDTIYNDTLTATFDTKIP